MWQCLAYSNSCVNPIIYNHTSKDFRDAFRGAFSTRRRGTCNLDTVTGRGALEVGAAGGTTRGGQLQRSTKAVTELNQHVGGITVEDQQPQQQQQHQHGVDDVDSLSDCSNRVHLKD